MDPIAHTLAGASLSASGMRRITPLATATLVLAANAPDIDIVAQFFGPYVALEWRRGVTHGILALVVLPFIVAGAILLWDRLARRRRSPDAQQRARPWPVLALATLGVWTHPALDWLNTYGMRWLMPFDGRWFYGDALFIIDPWLWLLLGGASFLVFSGSARAQVAWGLFGGVLTAVVLIAPIPVGAKLIWALGIIGLVVTRIVAGAMPADPYRRMRWARACTVGACVYIAGMVAQAQAAAALVQAHFTESEVTVRRVMVAPEPANPMAGSFVVETSDRYLRGNFHWLHEPRVVRKHPPIDRGADGPVVAAARQAPEARRYLTWSRFPFFRVRETAGGHQVVIGDARFPDVQDRGGLQGVTIELDHSLRPIPKFGEDVSSQLEAEESGEMLPPPREVFDRYVAAIGGRSRHLEVAGVRTEGRIELGGLEGNYSVLRSPPDRMLMRTEVAGIGEVLAGFDGEYAWSVNPVTGPRLLEGEEAAQLADQASVLRALRDESLIDDAVTTGCDEVDGKVCYRIEIRWTSGRETSDCYSTTTGLLLATESTQVTELGPVSVSVVYEEYRDVDGLRFPVRMRQRIMGRDQSMSVDRIELEEIPGNALAAPDEIRALVDDRERPHVDP